MNIFMKQDINRILAKLMIIVMLVTVILPLSSAYFQENQGKVYAAVPFDGLAIQAVRNNYGLHQGGKAVDGNLGNFGAYDAYILTQTGADLSTWEYGGTSLKERILSLIDATIANPNEMTTDFSGNPAYARSAKKIASEYLAAKTWNETVRANQLLGVLQGRQTTRGDGSFDGSAFSDLPAFEAVGRAGAIDQIDTAGAITFILGNQDGGTGAWTASWNDLQATAQAVRALRHLEPLAGGQTVAVQTAIDAGKTWLQGRQQADGGFRDAAGWDDPLIDTAEVILTLDCLGIDPTTWVKEGKSAIDYMRDNALNGDGTFGNGGSNGNLADNTWALDAYGILGGSVAPGTVLAVDVAPATAVIEVGDNQQYTAQSYRFDGTTEDISATATWTVNDTAKATVNASGQVAGIATGNAVVTATSQSVNGTANVRVIVLYDERAIQAVRNNYSLYMGGKAVDGNQGNFGAYDAYILTQAGAELGTWEYGGTSLKDRVLSLIDATIANPNEMTTDFSGNPAYARSAKKIASEYLAAKSWNETVRANQLLGVLQGRQTTRGDGSFDGSAFSDLPAFEVVGRAGAIDQIDTAGAITFILGNQDGGTGAWTASWNEFQATAQAVRALKYLEALAGGQTVAVQTAIDAGKTWLQGRQQADGSFRDAAGWDDPLIDTAEVILTLDCLGIDPTTWVVGGKSAINFMRDNALNADGTFGNGGSNGNLADNTWALDAYGMLGGSVAGATVLAVAVTPATATIVVGDTAQYTAHSYKMNGTTEDISATATWTVNDTAKATVNASGLVSGVAAGNAVVTATSLGVSGTANIVVPGGGGVIIPPPAGTPVKVKVTGRSGETLYSLNTVYLQAGDRNSRGDEVGITPVGALDKTGLSYSYDSIDFMHTISGQTPEGMNGWMYKVNGVTMGVPAISCALNANDQVWWFYSTDSENIVGLDPLLLIPIAQVTGDDLISEALEKGQNIKINLEKRLNMMVELGQESIRKLNEMQKEMNITNQGINVTFTPSALYTEAVRKALDEGNSTLQIGAKEVSASEKEEILAKAKLGQSSGLFEIGGKLVDLTAQIVRESSDGKKSTEKINSFNEPVKVTLDLSNTHLSEEEIAQLTAVRYEKDAQGNIIPVKLGGTYDPESKTFTFYTEQFSYYGIVKAENLVRVSLGINMLTTTVNGKRGYTDVPPILINDRTMVPLRFIAESLGATVQWLEESRSVKIKLGEKLLQLVVEETVPGLDTPPTIKGGRVLVPLRFVSETLGARVTWFSSTQRIEIVR